MYRLVLHKAMRKYKRRQLRREQEFSRNGTSLRRHYKRRRGDKVSCILTTTQYDSCYLTIYVRFIVESGIVFPYRNLKYRNLKTTFHMNLEKVFGPLTVPIALGNTFGVRDKGIIPLRKILYICAKDQSPSLVLRATLLDATFLNLAVKKHLILLLACSDSVG